MSMQFAEELVYSKSIYAYGNYKYLFGNKSFFKLSTHVLGANRSPSPKARNTKK